MVKIICYISILVIFSLLSEASDIKRFHGVRIDSYPKYSCKEISNQQSIRRCFIACASKMDLIFMISHNTVTKMCRCCSDLSGNDIVSPHWKTYAPSQCAEGYVSSFTSLPHVCFKHVHTLATYGSAVNHCQAEGGDLIKIDSWEKYNIYGDYFALLTNIYGFEMQIWVQAIKSGVLWQFHDGTPFPEICPIGSTNGLYEFHLRAKLSGSLECIDDVESNVYYYICEYYSL